MPQARVSLCPMPKKGWPVSVAPAPEKPGVTMRARYHIPGAVKPRWGSFASNGLPLVVRLPSTTHSFDALARCRYSGIASAMLAKSTSWYLFDGVVRVVGLLAGSTGHRSAICCSSSACAICWRDNSSVQLPDSNSAISRPHMALSAAFHGSGSTPSRTSSGGRLVFGDCSQAFTLSA